MSDHANNTPENTPSAGIATQQVEQRRKLVKKMAAGAFGAPLVLASLASKAAANSAV